MFKNLLKLLAIFTTSGTLLSQTIDIVKDQNQNLINEYNNATTATMVATNEGYKELIKNDEDSLMYYGRVLKYFIANSVTVDQANIDQLYTFASKLKSNNSSITTQQQDLIVQNIIASTINISTYGTSSDQEFYAESFSKWMLTPDALKNKSWEILNDFFVDVLPEIITKGGSFSTTYENIKSIIADYFTNNPGRTTYDLTLASVPTNKVVLQYAASGNVWAFSNDSEVKIKEETYSINVNLYYILAQQSLLTANTDIANWSTVASVWSSLSFLNNTWMNDTYTPASRSAIEKFNNANTHHFETLTKLDSVLAEASKDSKNNSQININASLAAIEEKYMANPPTNTSSSDYDAWTKDSTTMLGGTILNMYNYLWNYVDNSESAINNISTALIFVADSKLDGSDSGVMGSTITYMTDPTKSTYYTTVESYVLILGSALTFAEFNSQYTQGFWSSPAKFAVVVHEYGHVLDSFASRLTSIRDGSQSTKTTLTQKYAGLIFGYNKLVSSTEEGGNTLLWVFGTLMGITIVGGVIAIIFVSSSKRKKA